MKGVQCYELFGGISLKNHAFSFFIFFYDGAWLHLQRRSQTCLRFLTIPTNALLLASKWHKGLKKHYVICATCVSSCIMHNIYIYIRTKLCKQRSLLNSRYEEFLHFHSNTVSHN